MMLAPRILPNEPEFDDSETVGAIINGLGLLLGPMLAAGVPPDIVWRALDHVSHKLKESLQ